MLTNKEIQDLRAVLLQEASKLRGLLELRNNAHNLPLKESDDIRQAIDTEIMCCLNRLEDKIQNPEETRSVPVEAINNVKDEKLQEWIDDLDS